MVEVSEGDDATLCFTRSGDRVFVTAEFDSCSGLLNWVDCNGDNYGSASMAPNDFRIVLCGWVD